MKQYNLFYLTNYHDELFKHSFTKYEFFQLFEGGVVSAHVKQIKPDQEIYEILINKYGLNVQETIFIDDSHKNTLAAEQLGIESIHLKEPHQLKCLLERKLNLKL